MVIKTIERMALAVVLGCFGTLGYIVAAYPEIREAIWTVCAPNVEPFGLFVLLPVVTVGVVAALCTPERRG